MTAVRWALSLTHGGQKTKWPLLNRSVTEPGLYGVKCKPHFGMGMVALIQVGDDTPANLEPAKAAAAKLPKKATDRMSTFLAQVN